MEEKMIEGTVLIYNGGNPNFKDVKCEVIQKTDGAIVCCLNPFEDELSDLFKSNYGHSCGGREDFYGFYMYIDGLSDDPLYGIDNWVIHEGDAFWEVN